MKNPILIISILVFALLQATAQKRITLIEKNSDCSGAIELTDHTTIAVNTPTGYGKLLEFSDNSKQDTLFIEREHNTVWYYFKAKADGELSFDIIPQSVNDDYDFMLYKFTDADFCFDVVNKNILPVRSCISRNDKSIKSCTGIKPMSKEEYIRSGPGAAYCSNILVHKNDVYFLLLDNVYSNGKGHTIKLKWNYHPLPMLLVENEILTFEDIEFQPGTDKFSTSSFFWLDSLKRIMQHHPSLQIEIRGHVDGFKKTNDSTYQIMSEKRAKAVYDYLIKNNISPDRMEYNGYGNTLMKFKNPYFNPKEHRQNRRVEIKILKV